MAAALAVSCLLHASIFVMPYFGASTSAPRPAVRSAQKPVPAHVLDLRLGQGDAAEPRPAAPTPARGSNQLPIRAPAYYRTDQLTKPPQPTSAPQVDLPKSVARSASGKVVLKLWISELGKVESVEVESSNLPETVSGTAALAFKKIRFVPGEIDGRRVRALMTIEVVYGKRPRP